jgi:histidinol phosphatase-like enzyme
VTDHFICGDAADGASTFRKPATGMIKHLLSKHKRIPGQAIMIGDAIEDELCALRAGLARFFWGWRYFGAPVAPPSG